MKILAFSDLHSGQDTVKKIDALLEKQKFDLALIPGDITNPGHEALEYVKNLNKMFQKHGLKWLCVHGNNDREEVVKFLLQNHLDLHYEPQTFGGYKFIGIGGWGDEFPPYDLKFDQKTIFLTHIPPKVQPNSLRLPTPDSQPFLHLAGHQHNWQRHYDLGSTRIVNLPGTKFSDTVATIILPQRLIKFFKLPNKSII